MKQLLGFGLASVVALGATAQAQENTSGGKAKRAARIVPASSRQAPSQEDLIGRRDAKLAEPWVKNAAWITDYDEAQRVANETGKKIFAYFTRSYSP